VRKRASHSKRVRISLPARFKIVPLRAPKKTSRKVRSLTDGGPNPCPAGCTCQGTINIGEISYWVCLTADGSTILIRIP
jgi:hypothetical protein